MLDEKIKQAAIQFANEITDMIRTVVQKALGDSPDFLDEMIEERKRTNPPVNKATKKRKKAKKAKSATDVAAVPVVPPAKQIEETATKKVKGKGKSKAKKGGATDEDVAKVLLFVRDNPSKTSEAIQKGLGADGPIVKAALAKLLKSKTVKSSGKARGTTYTAA